MNLIHNVMGGLGAVLLPVATALLFEELTFGGLVRLLIVPRRGNGLPTRRTSPSSGAKLQRRYNPRSKDCTERRDR